MRLVSYRAADGPVRVAELDGELLRPLAAASMIAWLEGEGTERDGDPVELDGVELLAPVPAPPSIRDFFAFERHVATVTEPLGGIPEAWYEAPVFYFSSPATVHGPGQPVARPPSTERLDFELEIAAVLDGRGEIGGFTLFNDWSARDVQSREMTVGIGPHKCKDFANTLGPWLVTPDELPYQDGRLQVNGRVTVNGDEVTSSTAADQRFGWPEMVAHAGRDSRLRAGDVLGSGTLGEGCLLELGPLEGDRWIEPGDVVALEVDGLGTLETPVVAPDA